MSLFTQRVYVMQSKTLSDMTNNVFIEYLKKFLYSSVDQVVELCEQFFFSGHRVFSARQFRTSVHGNSSAARVATMNRKPVKFAAFLGREKLTS